jgi:hypothetical protein
MKIPHASALKYPASEQKIHYKAFAINNLEN